MNSIENTSQICYNRNDGVLSAIMEADSMKKFVAIYARRSKADKENKSMSIESQIEDCVKSLKEGEEYQIYKEEKSGKDIEHRPEFQRMIKDVEDGLISRIVVKKIDRFGRNIREALNVIYKFTLYDVGVTSVTEPFDTTTKEGRLMLNQFLSFAEFERETIAYRVKDAYDTKANSTGFYLGGKKYYGYLPEKNRLVDGRKGSVLVPSPQAEFVKTMYQLYNSPDVSLRNIIEYFRENGINVNKSDKTNMDRTHLSQILKSPLYVRANAEVYQFLVSKGFEVVDDVSLYDSIHGLFKHKNENGQAKDKRNKNKPKGEREPLIDSDYYIKVGYHEGLIDPDLWLSVQDKKSHNKRIPKGNGAKHSWLAGLVKCGKCFCALATMYNYNASKTIKWRYWRDSGAYRANGCISKRLDIRPDETEEAVYEAMKQRLETLVIAKTQKQKPDPEVEIIKSEIIRCDNEIKKLMNRLATEDDTDKFFTYIKDMVTELHKKKLGFEDRLWEKERKRKDVDTTPIEDPLNRWNDLTTEEKHELAAIMIDVVYVDDEHGIDIRFSI